MQYKVPQNIDQEDKILGPFTFVQFIYLLIGGAVIILLFASFSFLTALFFAVPIIIITLAFSLIKVQDQPFSRFVMALFVYLMQPKKRIWHDLESERVQREASQATKEPVAVKAMPAPQKIDIAKSVPVSTASATTPTPAPSAKPARKLTVTTASRPPGGTP